MSENTTEPPCKVDNVDYLIGLNICLGVAYIVMLLPFLVYNIMQYVIKQKRYKVFLVATFYLLSAVVIPLRAWAFFIVASKSNSETFFLWFGEPVHLIGQFLKLGVGFVQSASITELYFRMDYLQKWKLVNS